MKDQIIREERIKTKFGCKTCNDFGEIHRDNYMFGLPSVDCPDCIKYENVIYERKKPC